MCKRVLYNMPCCCSIPGGAVAVKATVAPMTCIWHQIAKLSQRTGAAYFSKQTPPVVCNKASCTPAAHQALAGAPAIS